MWAVGLLEGSMCVFELGVDTPIFPRGAWFGWFWVGIFDADGADLMVEGTSLALVKNIGVLLLTDITFDGLQVGDFE